MQDHNGEEALSTQEAPALEKPSAGTTQEETAAAGSSASTAFVSWQLPLLFVSVVIAMYAAIAYALYRLVASVL